MYILPGVSTAFVAEPELRKLTVLHTSVVQIPFLYPNGLVLDCCIRMLFPQLEQVPQNPPAIIWYDMNSIFAFHHRGLFFFYKISIKLHLISERLKMSIIL